MVTVMVSAIAPAIHDDGIATTVKPRGSQCQEPGPPIDMKMPEKCQAQI